ncbi:hypothetical protein LVD15_04200 [Fulvivirga maritima]|uniref:hypothetical protein n=1 Tax=Fulvivirga maritima TaxID=2904247 RepID=UPI001F262B62|nr:hypothetical protein [Fulvivirga maritima]UII27636.1 hypothetical protein LVD15_04200 [Fulvivirga maritima]
MNQFFRISAIVMASFLGFTACSDDDNDDIAPDDPIEEPEENLIITKLTAHEWRENRFITSIGDEIDDCYKDDVYRFTESEFSRERRGVECDNDGSSFNRLYELNSSNDTISFYNQDGDLLYRRLISQLNADTLHLEILYEEDDASSGWISEYLKF